MLIGLPFGLLLGHFKKLDAFISPIIYILSPVPKISLLPLILLAFGIGNFSKVFMIFLVIVFQAVVVTRDAVKEIPKEFFQPFIVAGAGKACLFRNIVLPASIPAVFTSLRISLGTGISVLFFTETFGTTWGLGYYIMDMWVRLDYRQMYLGIFTIGILGLLCASAIDFAEKKLCPWK